MAHRSGKRLGKYAKVFVMKNIFTPVDSLMKSYKKMSQIID